MPEPEPPIGLGLNASAAPPASNEVLPSAESLQFRKAEHARDPASGPQCLSCKRATGPNYFQVNGQTVCGACAAAIESGQKTTSRGLLLKGLLYGVGAALAGSILYATVAIITGFQLALIAILIGYMVGKSIHKAAGGGRPQQITAVILTYLSISSSYVPLVIYQFGKHPSTQSTTANEGKSGTVITAPQVTRPSVPLSSTLVALASLAVAGPFMALRNSSGLLSLVIIFFGLQRAWRLTGRPILVLSGPYQAATPA